VSECLIQQTFSEHIKLDISLLRKYHSGISRGKTLYWTTTAIPLPYFGKEMVPYTCRALWCYNEMRSSAV